jgi:hypothetical protein
MSDETRTRKTEGEAEALAALARAFRRGWPARMIEKAAPGWAELLLASLRTDPSGRDAVAAALLDEETLAGVLATPGLLPAPVDDPRALARTIIEALAPPS